VFENKVQGEYSEAGRNVAGREEYWILISVVSNFRVKLYISRPVHMQAMYIKTLLLTL
jgi:hypothetical protein